MSELTFEMTKAVSGGNMASYEAGRTIGAGISFAIAILNIGVTLGASYASP